MRREHHKVRDFLAYALGYGTKLGFRVIPLTPGKKAPPLIPDWQNQATNDEAKIREWWTRWPNANIGIVTGRYRDGYFVVLDFDPRNGGDWFDDVGEDILPPTWVVETPSGGRHYYYRTRELLRSAKLPGGVDLKGEGGYVVAPPSVILDDEGNFIGDYSFQLGRMPKDVGMGEAADWVFSDLRGKVGGMGGGASDGKSGGSAVRGRSLWLMPPPIPKGMRHDYLVSLAGAFWSAGLTKEEVEAILWAALELLETREDFDPKREIEGILKGLQRWEGDIYSIGSLLHKLPERTAAVARRVIMGGVGEVLPVANDVGADTQNKKAVESHTQAEEGSRGGEAVRTDVQTEGGEAGVGKAKEGKLLAAEIVSRLETRQKEGGGICFVYRKADGTELEAPCTPKGVKDLLGRLGVKATLKEIEKLLGVVRPDGEGEAREKKERRAKTVDIEDIKVVLGRYKWVKWQGDLWQVTKPTIYKADLDRLHGVLKQNGLDVGKETLRSYMAEIKATLPKSRLQGLVVTPEPTYGVVGELRGLWFRHREDLYLVTPTEIRIFPAGQWPEGIYTLDTGDEGVLPDWNGTPEHTLGYWEGITARLAEDKKIPHEAIQRVTLAMFLPVLFGQGHIGLILFGAARSGKSTLLKALGYLRYGSKPETPNGLNLRDLMAVLQRRQMVFFDEVNTFTNEIQEALKRMITHDRMLMRALYTDLGTVEAELEGSAIFCTTNLGRLSSDLRTRCFVWSLEERGGSLYEHDILAFCSVLWRLALGGAIRLYQQAARLKRPPNNFLPEIRFRDWLAWAYRYAVVLGVEKEFVIFVKKAKAAAHSGDKYGFLLDLIYDGKIEPNREYTTTELIQLAGTDEAKGLRYALKSESVRADLIAMVRDIGYNLRLEKMRVKGDTKDKYRFVFTPLQTSTENHRLREILQRLGVAAKISEDDDSASLPPESASFTPTPPIAPRPFPISTPRPPSPPNNFPTLQDNPPPQNSVSERTAQDETKTLIDMTQEKKNTPTQPVAEESQTVDASSTSPSTSVRPMKTKLKKTPLSSEWVYRAGIPPRNRNDEVSEGLFAPAQDTQSTTTLQLPPAAHAHNTDQDDGYPSDDEIIEYIEERLKLHAQHQLPLETSLDWLRRFLLQHELKMWEVGLKKAYFHIVNREVELQNTMEKLGYEELTSENDPRLRPLQVRLEEH